MKVFITGGGGFLGYRLARALLDRGALVGADGRDQAVGEVICFDTAFPVDADPRVKCVTGDLAAPGALAAAMPHDTVAVFHLAAVVSAGAEADFDLGYRVNLDGTRLLLEQCRTLARPPRVVFTSSVAAFGGELPDTPDDTTTPNPQSSYGTQKVIGEYLVTDYTRKGFIDGRTLRLPTVVVRPGKPNLAASSFASGIIREPLAGDEALCPVDPDDTGVWLLSPAKVIDAFIHAHDLPASAWGTRRVVNVPGITVGVREMIATLGRVAGEHVAKRVIYRPDAKIQAIVRTWPTRFRTERALAMGFAADVDFESVVRAHIRDARIAV
jgi:nucleoside-diphosphate-sugar epimerase